MRERDWTPVVLFGSTICIVVVGMVWVTTPWLQGTLFRDEPGPTLARTLPPAEVAVWAGEVAPGVKGLLGPVWGDPGPDTFHDQALEQALDLPEGVRLAWYRLLLFNTSGEERTVRLVDGTLSMRSAGSETPVTLRSLASMASRGEVAIKEGRRSLLKSVGALDESVRIPAGSMASLLIPFTERVDLGSVREVATVDGTAFHRRPMPRAELQALLDDPPDLERVKDL